MEAFVCPKGHQSADPDYCSECGAKIKGAPVEVVAPKPTAEKCPDCGAAREVGVFCEICGFNFATGTHGEVPLNPPVNPVPPAVEPDPRVPLKPVVWRLVVDVDPSRRFDESPDPPADWKPVTIDLDRPVSLIGRKSESRAIFPEIPLDFDDAVSHRHAVIMRGDNGTLSLRDIGAANGTRINGKDVEPMVDQVLQDGDEISLGHWTRLTVKS